MFTEHFVFRMSPVTHFIFQQVELLGQLAKYLQKLVALLLLPKELQVKKFLNSFCFAFTLGLLPCLCRGPFQYYVIKKVGG